MFEEFLYTLRQGGLKVSLTEWMSLMEALDKGLHRSSFTGFYHLCRCLLVKSEADFDAFDRCFLDYFQGVPAEEEVSQELLRWLDRPNAPLGEYDEQQAELNESLSQLEIETLFQERRREQREQHNCGSYWVGTHGMSVFGNLGMSPAGLRVGGESRQRRAFRVAGERRYRDFRKDSTLDNRQLQVALRRLRQYSGLVDLPATEFDVDGTIRDTAEHAGAMNIRYKKPRQNTVKVLLLMDSGGSMGVLRLPVLRPVPGGEQVQPFQGPEDFLLPQLPLYPGVPRAHPGPQPRLPGELAALQHPAGVQGDLCGGRPDAPLRAAGPLSRPAGGGAGQRAGLPAPHPGPLPARRLAQPRGAARLGRGVDPDL